MRSNCYIKYNARIGTAIAVTQSADKDKLPRNANSFIITNDSELYTVKVNNQPIKPAASLNLTNDLGGEWNINDISIDFPAEALTLYFLPIYYDVIGAVEVPIINK